MPSALSRTEAKQNALSAFIRFHKESNQITRAVKMEPNDASRGVGTDTDIFTEEDVKCSLTRGLWVCLIYHLHLSRTQKGMPYVFKYVVQDNLLKAKFECKPIAQMRHDN